MSWGLHITSCSPIDEISEIVLALKGALTDALRLLVGDIQGARGAASGPSL